MRRLDRRDLVSARIEGLIRLAAFLNLKVIRGQNETEGQFRHRLISAIQRWEKYEARKPKERIDVP